MTEKRSCLEAPTQGEQALTNAERRRGRSRPSSPRQSSVSPPRTTLQSPSVGVMPLPLARPASRIHRMARGLARNSCPWRDRRGAPGHRRTRPRKHSQTSSRRAATAAADANTPQLSMAAGIRITPAGRTPGMRCRASPATSGHRSIRCQRMSGSPLSTPSAAEGGGRRPAFQRATGRATLL